MRREAIQQGLLPVEYQEVAYIKSIGGSHSSGGYGGIYSNNPYINTLYKPTNNTRIFCKYRCVTPLDGYWAFGSRTSVAQGDAIGWCINTNARQLFAQFDGGSSIYSISDTTIFYNEITADVSKNGAFLNGNKIYTFPSSVFSSNHNIYIFNLNNNGSTTNGLVGAELSVFQIFEDDILVRDYIPAVRLQDATAGLYDLCGSIWTGTGTSFYTKAGGSGVLQYP